MSKFKAYFLNKEYHDFLKSNIQEFLFKDRPYIGFVGIKVLNQNYAIPLWSDNNNKYKTNHKYSFFIPDENNKKLGILRIDKMIPIQDNENYVREISINELPYDESIRLIKELEYINQPEIASKINLLAHEARMMKDDKLKFNIDFDLAEKYCFEWAKIKDKKQNNNYQYQNVYKRYESYFSSKHISSMIKSLIKYGDWDSIIDDLQNLDEKTAKKILNYFQSDNFISNWLKENKENIILDSTDLYFQKLNELENEEVIDDLFSFPSVGIEFSACLEYDEFENHLENDYLIKELIFQHIWSEMNHIDNDEEHLEKVKKQMNNQKSGI